MPSDAVARDVYTEGRDNMVADACSCNWIRKVGAFSKEGAVDLSRVGERREHQVGDRELIDFFRAWL